MDDLGRRTRSTLSLTSLLYVLSNEETSSSRADPTLCASLQDSESHNPLVRALSLRTMTSIPLPSIISAVIDPLRHGLKDSDPYVRKTAALSVAKLYSTPPGRTTLDRSPHFIGALRDLLADSNPTVVANAVAALVEISERSEEIALRLNVTVAGKLVAALNECSECVSSWRSSCSRSSDHSLSIRRWSQVYILDSLLSFTPQNVLDAESLAERIAVRLQHANSAVVLTTVKVILYLMNYMADEQTIKGLERKMGPPLGAFAAVHNWRLFLVADRCRLPCDQ